MYRAPGVRTWGVVLVIYGFRTNYAKMYGFQQPMFIILLFIPLGNQGFRFKASNEIAAKLLKVAALSSEGQGRITSTFTHVIFSFLLLWSRTFCQLLASQGFLMT